MVINVGYRQALQFRRNRRCFASGGHQHSRAHGFGAFIRIFLSRDIPLHPVRLVRLVACLLVMLTVTVCFQPTRTAAQDATTTDPASIQSETEETGVFAAPVVIKGETLFQVRGSSVLPASERAMTVENRIYALTELSENGPLRFEVRQNEFGMGVFANNRLVTVVTEADAEFEQFDMEGLAQLQAEAIEAAVRAYWLDRSDDARVDSAVAAVAWTFGFLSVTLLFFRRRYKLIQALARLTERHFTHVEAATKSVVQGKAVAHLVSFAANVVLWIVYLFALYYYLSVVLLSFAETRLFAQILLDYVSEPLIGVVFGFLGYIPSLIMLAIIALITRYAIRGVRILLDNVDAGIFEWKNFEPHWVNPT